VPRSPFGKDKSNLFKLASMIMIKPKISAPQPEQTVEEQQLMEFEQSPSPV